MEDVATVARAIEATRSAKSHSLNDRSSRSHCLISISLQQIKDEYVSFYKSFASTHNLAGE